MPDAPSRAVSAPTTTENKYNNKKAISSADFFGDIEQESAVARMERENRYQKFSSSTAISSSNFFGDGDPAADIKRQDSGDGFDDWKGAVGSVAGKGADLAKASIHKGAELLTTYLNKVR